MLNIKRKKMETCYQLIAINKTSGKKNSTNKTIKKKLTVVYFSLTKFEFISWYNLKNTPPI